MRGDHKDQVCAPPQDISQELGDGKRWMRPVWQYWELRNGQEHDEPRLLELGRLKGVVEEMFVAQELEGLAPLLGKDEGILRKQNDVFANRHSVLCLPSSDSPAFHLLPRMLRPW